MTTDFWSVVSIIKQRQVVPKAPRCKRVVLRGSFILQLPIMAALSPIFYASAFGGTDVPAMVLSRAGEPKTARTPGALFQVVGAAGKLKLLAKAEGLPDGGRLFERWQFHEAEAPFRFTILGDLAKR